jgi:hypothetical protein
MAILARYPSKYHFPNWEVTLKIKRLPGYEQPFKRI